jgi:hypothetical protein
MVSHNARLCTENLSYVDLNNQLFNSSYITYSDQRRHLDDENNDQKHPRTRNGTSRSISSPSSSFAVFSSSS